MLRQGLEDGLPVANLMENWDFLQVRMDGWSRARERSGRTTGLCAFLRILTARQADRVKAHFWR